MSVAKFVSRQSHVEKSRYVFRSLLRECTYLPDPAAQKYIAKYVRWRFENGGERAVTLLGHVEKPDEKKQKRHRNKYGKKLERSPAPDAPEELGLLLKKAYKGLHQLIRANEGELRPLMKVLRHTYGRNGPLRYELMRSLLTPDSTEFASKADDLNSVMLPSPKGPPHISTVSIPSPLVPPKDTKGTTLTYTISPAYSRLNAIVTSQSQRNIDSPRTRLSPRISIPAKNTWGRSMPRVRVKNLVADKYAKMLDGILPPLREHDWKRLQGLVMGAEKWEGRKGYRKRPKGAPPRLTATDLEKLTHLSDDFGKQLHLGNHISASDNTTEQKIINKSAIGGYWSTHDTWLSSHSAVDHAFDRVLEDELGVKTLNKNLAGRDRGHAITERLMRRLWARVFAECPVLVPDGGNGRKWMVEWGRGPRMLDKYRSEAVGDGGQERWNELFGIAGRLEAGARAKGAVASR
jgi:hypothetical protein